MGWYDDIVSRPYFKYEVAFAVPVIIALVLVLVSYFFNPDTLDIFRKKGTCACETDSSREWTAIAIGASTGVALMALVYGYDVIGKPKSVALMGGCGDSRGIDSPKIKVSY